MNLDLMAQRKAQKIVDDCLKTEQSRKDAANNAENLVTKALGVLQENGMYAAALHLWTRRKEDQSKAEAIRRVLLETARELTTPAEKRPMDRPGEALKFLSEKVCSDLDHMLLVKQVWEQTLVYARFGAKAEKGPE